MAGPITHWAYSDDGETLAITSSGNTVVTVNRSTGQVSDGYHTFDELYRYRMLYNAALFNAWVFAPDILRFDVHKSWRHHDGTSCFALDPGEWFIVMAYLPSGQISNHYPADAWDLFKIPERERANEWDGHTPTEAADRLERFLRGDL
jgi:hypothetical protein